MTSRGRDMFGHLVTFQCPWAGDISHLVFLPDTKCAKSETTQRKEFSMAMLESHTYWKTIQITGFFSKQRTTFKATTPCPSSLLLFPKASPARSAQMVHGEGTLSEAWGSGLGSLVQRPG